MQRTKVPWTEFSWNPGCGCPLPIASVGCVECRARKLHNQRHKAYKAGKKLPVQYAKAFEEIQLFSDRLNEPLRRKKSCKIAVWLMGDLFHKDVPFEFIDDVWWTMSVGREHIFQVLTKRPEICLKYWQYRLKMGYTDGYRKNIWIGTTIEHPDYKHRIDDLREIPAAIRFLSLEPLLADLGELNLEGIHWVIVGAESGPKKRLCKLEWVRDIVEQCKSAGVAVFVKQLDIDGKLVKDISYFSKDLQIQEFPL